MGGIRFEPDGTVTIITGTLDYGQGHASPFAQVLSTRLSIPFRKIRLLQGDSDALIAGGGTGGSKSMMTSGTAIVEAGEKVIAAGKEIAAHVLEAAAADIEFRSGRFTIAGTDRSVGLMELAEKIHAGLQLPPGLPQSLDVQNISDGPPSAFPNGCHIAEVEVDPETGMAEVVRYTFVNDFGTVINPLLVNGQAHGGIVQGIGQALREHVVYDEEGQLLTGSYMDYTLPRAGDAPAGQDQRPRGQGVRRGRLRRGTAVGHERAGRCARRIRHPAYRHAGDPGAGVARDHGGALILIHIVRRHGNRLMSENLSPGRCCHRQRPAGRGVRGHRRGGLRQGRHARRHGVRAETSQQPVTDGGLEVVAAAPIRDADGQRQSPVRVRRPDRMRMPLCRRPASLRPVPAKNGGAADRYRRADPSHLSSAPLPGEEGL